LDSYADDDDDAAAAIENSVCFCVCVWNAVFVTSNKKKYI